MDYILNLVYDRWDDLTNLPKPNGVEDDKYYYSLSSFQLKTAIKNINTIDYKIEDVIKFPYKKFFYHIWCRDTFNVFFDKNILPISDSVINLIKENKNLNLIFMNEVEVENKQSLKKLDIIVKQNGIDPNQVWMINNNSKLDEFKKALGCDINVHTSRRLCTSERQNLNLKIEKGGPFFLCHNRTPKVHRYTILCLLKKYGILNDVDWSIVQGGFQGYSQIFDQNDINEFSSEIEFFYNIGIHKSKYENGYSDADVRRFNLIFEPNSFENTYANIVTETLYFGEDVHITEKSFKPFAYYQFPLILASYQHIKYFKKSYDLDFFDDIINHDYDNIKDNKERIFRFVDEVKRINDNKEFFIDFYEKNQDRFIMNRQKSLSFNHDYDYNFFKYLSELR